MDLPALRSALLAVHDLADRLQVQRQRFLAVPSGCGVCGAWRHRASSCRHPVGGEDTGRSQGGRMCEVQLARFLNWEHNLMHGGDLESQERRALADRLDKLDAFNSLATKVRGEMEERFTTIPAFDFSDEK